MRPVVAVVLLVLFASSASAQHPGPISEPTGDLLTPAAPPETAPAIDAPLPLGQQHVLGLYLSILQPCVGTAQVTVYRRNGISYALEVYGGSELFELMYGGGVRAIWTAGSNNRCDAFLVKPGLGVHIFPENTRGGVRGWNYLAADVEYAYAEPKTARYYLAADVELSWLHDFSDRLGWEMGVKLGLAGRVGGQWGSEDPPNTPFAFGKSVYPIYNLFWGFRF